MYNDLITNDSVVMNHLNEEKEHAAIAEEKLENMRNKLTDLVNQRNGFNSSLAIHEANLKKVEEEIPVLNRNLQRKERSESKELWDLVRLEGELQKKVSFGETNLKKILEAQTKVFLTLENIDEEKFELEQKQQEQKKILEAPVDDNAWFFEKIKQRRRTSLMQGEFDKVSNKLQEQKTKEHELRAEIERLKAERQQQDQEIKKDKLIISSMEKTLQPNRAIIKEVARLRSKVQGLYVKRRIFNDKVRGLREQIKEKQQEIDDCSRVIGKLERTVAKRKANLENAHDEISDRVLLGIIEVD